MSALVLSPKTSPRVPTPDEQGADRQESLVTDDRDRERPADAVEQKLGRLLKGAFQPVSDLRQSRLIARR